MNGWSRLERRFLTTLLEGILPGAELGPLGGDPAVWTMLDRSAPPVLRLGLRVSAWLIGSWLGLLSPARRTRSLTRLAESRVYLVRQLVLSAKLVACFAHFSREGAHEPPLA